MNSLTFTIKPASKNKLKQFLTQLGCKFEERPNAEWIAKDETATLTLYRNGRLLVQGKEAPKMVEILKAGAFLDLPKPPKSSETGRRVTAWMGVDEAGKGDYFGPLVIGAFLVTKTTAERLWKAGVRDSKTLSDHSIAGLAKELGALAHHEPDQYRWTLVTINPKRYNELHAEMKNLNRVLAWGHARAIENILNQAQCRFALSDKFGDARFIEAALMDKGKKITVEQRTQAEDDIGVAAASVIARAEFLKRLEELSDLYGIALPKGASDEVIDAGRQFVKKHGREKLAEVAKTHFKTTQQIIGKIGPATISPKP